MFRCEIVKIKLEWRGCFMRYNPDEECDKLIENLKVLCELKSMSYYAVATKAEISNSTIHSLMSGKTRPYIHTLFKLCNALDVTVEDILCSNLNVIEEKEAIKKSSLEQIIYSSQTIQETRSFYDLKVDENELLLRYRYFSEQKKAMLRVYVEMLYQYNERIE
jgi:transcriptional regulator with XRE-family HTH domain